MKIFTSSLYSYLSHMCFVHNNLRELLPQKKENVFFFPTINLKYNSKCEWNNSFIQNAHNISRILPDFVCKNNRFLAWFLFEQTCTVTIFGEHGIMIHIQCTTMAKPIRALELHYPMIQFLNMCFIIQPCLLEFSCFEGTHCSLIQNNS